VKHLKWIGCLFLLPALATPSWAQAPASSSGWKVEIAPIYAWVPSFKSSVTLPELPDFPSPPGGAEAKTGTSTNIGALVGFHVEKSRILFRGSFLVAGLSADKDQPKLHVSLNGMYGEFFGGFAVTPHFYVEGGVRRLAFKAKAQFLTYPEVSTKPGIWDPVFGASYRQPLSKKWIVTVHGDAGGFGVGSDLDVSANATFDWHPSTHVGMILGYQAAYVRFSHPVLESTRFSRDLKLGATLYGPTLGIKLMF
jgi:hypothetical protein